MKAELIELFSMQTLILYVIKEQKTYSNVAWFDSSYGEVGGGGGGILTQGFCL